MSDNANNTENRGNAGTSQDPKDLPDWARKAISDANGEAAKYRIKANEIESQTRTSVTAEFTDQLKAVSDEKSAIAAERDTSVASYNKLVAALAAGVPGESAVEFAALLQGKDQNEFKAHAEKLLGMFGSGRAPRAVDPSHGAGGSASGQGTDDAWVALMKSAGIQ